MAKEKKFITCDNINVLLKWLKKKSLSLVMEMRQPLT